MSRQEKLMSVFDKAKEAAEGLKDKAEDLKDKAQEAVAKLDDKVEGMSEKEGIVGKVADKAHDVLDKVDGDDKK
jgi:prefoldin subunit 5